MKGSTIAQCINVLQNNVNPSWLPFLCEKTGAIALVQVGLTAGRLADKMLLHLDIFRISYILDETLEI